MTDVLSALGAPPADFPTKKVVALLTRDADGCLGSITRGQGRSAVRRFRAHRLARCNLRHNATYEWRSAVANSLLAGVAFVLLTLLCLSLKLNVATAAFAYLILIVLASVRIERGVLGRAFARRRRMLLDFLFATPPFTLWIENRSDAALIFAFLGGLHS